MKIEIHDFRGVADLSATIDGVLLIAGPNGAGKSSACSAIAACLTGDLLPFEGVTKAKAGLLVRDGGAEASAIITGPDGGASVIWPACERAEKGRAPWASPVAAGLTNPLAMTPKDRAAWLIDLIGALPTLDDTTHALASVGVAPAEATAIWSGIEARGWQAAHAEAKERGAKFKGQWERVTGARYGSAKAAAWRPEGWRSGIDALGLHELASAAEAAASRHDEVRRAGLVSEVKRREAQDAISAGQRAASERDHAAEIAQAAKRAHEHAQAARDRLGVSAGRVLRCPCCNAGLVLIDGALQRAPAGGAAPADVAAADDKLRSATAQASAARAHYERLLSEIEAGKKAEAFTATLPATPADADAIKRAADEGVAALRMKRQVSEATELHERITSQIAVVALLAEDGLRQSALVEALSGFASELAAITGAAGWRPVYVDADMALSYGGRPVSLCSAGEQYRARCVLQIAAARRDGSALVILDGADILDRDGRNGLMRVLRDTPAIIGMTMRREDVPEKLLADGRAAWIEPESRRIAA